MKKKKIQTKNSFKTKLKPGWNQT